MRNNIFPILLLFFGMSISPMDWAIYKPKTYEHVTINSNIQRALIFGFKKSLYKKVEGFYDPRVGAVFIADFSGFTELDSSLPKKSKANILRNKDRIHEKIKKTRFLLKIRKIVKPNDRIIFGTYSKDGYKLEIWKKEALDKLDNPDQS
ncbi:MAG: hypothetical protein KDK36_17735, partial [Leptospiraceae bacterium]|nr:hypothetical protein [Leptospiraceae bacterium]